MRIENVVNRVILDLKYVSRGKMFGNGAFFAPRRLYACRVGGRIAVRNTAADDRELYARCEEWGLC